MPDETPTPLVLFDGVCPLCHGAVRWILRHDRRRHVRFAPLDSPLSRRLLAAHPAAASVDSVVLLTRSGDEPPRALVRSAAVIGILRESGGMWPLVARLAALVPRPVADFAYDAVARRRVRLFGRYDACPLPPAGERERFLGGD